MKTITFKQLRDICDGDNPDGEYLCPFFVKRQCDTEHCPRWAELPQAHIVSDKQSETKPSNFTFNIVVSDLDQNIKEYLLSHKPGEGELKHKITINLSSVREELEHLRTHIVELEKKQCSHANGVHDEQCDLVSGLEREGKELCEKVNNLNSYAESMEKKCTQFELRAAWAEELLGEMQLILIEWKEDNVYENAEDVLKDFGTLLKKERG